jgi:hypothetical protein
MDLLDLRLRRKRLIGLLWRLMINRLRRERVIIWIKARLLELLWNKNGLWNWSISISVRSRLLLDGVIITRHCNNLVNRQRSYLFRCELRMKATSVAFPWHVRTRWVLLMNSLQILLVRSNKVIIVVLFTFHLNGILSNRWAPVSETARNSFLHRSSFSYILVRRDVPLWHECRCAKGIWIFL